MKMKNIIKKLEEKGYEVNYKTYSYWNNIPYVVNKDDYITYLIADTCADRQVGITQKSYRFTFKYVLECVENGRYNLGNFNYDNYVPFGDNKIFNESDDFVLATEECE